MRLLKGKRSDGRRDLGPREQLSTAVPYPEGLNGKKRDKALAEAIEVVKGMLDARLDQEGAEAMGFEACHCRVLKKAKRPDLARRTKVEYENQKNLFVRFFGKE